MKFINTLVIGGIITCLFFACSKKTLPAETNKPAANEPVIVKKKVPKTPTPKVIVVNDSSARKTFDGRLYYDLGGKRYWRNNKDGKYYLYNKSMQDDDAFKSKETL